MADFDSFAALALSPIVPCSLHPATFTPNTTFQQPVLVPSSGEAFDQFIPPCQCEEASGAIDQSMPSAQHDHTSSGATKTPRPNPQQEAELSRACTYFDQLAPDHEALQPEEPIDIRIALPSFHLTKPVFRRLKAHVEARNAGLTGSWTVIRREATDAEKAEHGVGEVKHKRYFLDVRLKPPARLQERHGGRARPRADDNEDDLEPQSKGSRTSSHDDHFETSHLSHAGYDPRYPVQWTIPAAPNYVGACERQQTRRWPGRQPCPC